MSLQGVAVDIKINAAWKQQNFLNVSGSKVSSHKHLEDLQAGRAWARSQPQLRLGIYIFHQSFCQCSNTFLSCTVRSAILLPLDVSLCYMELRQEVTPGKQRSLSGSWSNAEACWFFFCLCSFCPVSLMNAYSVGEAVTSQR